MTRHSHRFAVLAIAALFGLGVCAGPVLAAGDPDGGNAPKPSDSSKKKGSESKGKKKEQKSEQELRDGYQKARALIIDGRYEDGIRAMHALGHDDDAEVANYIGFAHRKLGHYDDAKVWYEKALAANPNHTRTWQYYGMWHLEQGNALKAQDHLEKIKLICGNTECRDYQLLKDALEGKVSY
jgi:tetratricopeptide (TPR) repeat protein